mmetsp:Transcript_18588/g.43791  ORF Transcript_18588/g.43791 Transcript_18588/m.43791 type:complete len:248 (+) Transcript_18588:122-865(+)
MPCSVRLGGSHLCHDGSALLSKARHGLNHLAHAKVRVAWVNGDVANGVPVVCPLVNCIGGRSTGDSHATAQGGHVVAAVGSASAGVGDVRLLSHVGKGLETVGALVGGEAVLDEVQLLAFLCLGVDVVIADSVWGGCTKDKSTLLVVVEDQLGLDGCHGGPANEPLSEFNGVGGFGNGPSLGLGDGTPPSEKLNASELSSVVFLGHASEHSQACVAVLGKDFVGDEVGGHLLVVLFVVGVGFVGGCG